mmetsp:Transcript_22571/g.67217  ORF Transcript_22571/g.67217 Transcript_22571/m.67217 type:complete len:426 (+) Transcript_22571:267-1544(+)
MLEMILELPHRGALAREDAVREAAVLPPRRAEDLAAVALALLRAFALVVVSPRRHLLQDIRQRALREPRPRAQEGGQLLQDGLSSRHRPNLEGGALEEEDLPRLEEGQDVLPHQLRETRHPAVEVPPREVRAGRDHVAPEVRVVELRGADLPALALRHAVGPAAPASGPVGVAVQQETVVERQEPARRLPDHDDGLEAIDLAEPPHLGPAVGQHRPLHHAQPGAWLPALHAGNDRVVLQHLLRRDGLLSGLAVVLVPQVGRDLRVLVQQPHHHGGRRLREADDDGVELGEGAAAADHRAVDHPVRHAGLIVPRPAKRGRRPVLLEGHAAVAVPLPVLAHAKVEALAPPDDVIHARAVRLQGPKHVFYPQAGKERGAGLLQARGIHRLDRPIGLQAGVDVAPRDAAAVAARLPHAPGHLPQQLAPG